jgi:hypothetical protein
MVGTVRTSRIDGAPWEVISPELQRHRDRGRL